MRAPIKNATIFFLTLALVGSLIKPTLGASSNELIFLHYWTGSMSGGINEMAASYNRTAPPRRVKATGFEHESFKVGINVMLAGGISPDMFSYWAGAKTRVLVDKGYLAPIDDVWDEADLDNIFPPSVAQACTYNGHKYALPVTQHYVAFFYNKKLFDKNRVSPPKTWNEFLKVCNTFKKAGIVPLALGSRERWPAQFWFDYLLLRTAGPDYRQLLVEGKASYTDIEVKNTFATWKMLFDKEYFNPTPNLLDWAEAAQQVHSGKAAMTLSGSWIIGLFENKLDWKQGEDYDFFRFPIMTDCVPMASLGPIDTIVLPKGDNLSAAKEALKFFSEPGPQMNMSRGSGALSPSRVIPDSFYYPLQRRILKTIRSTPHWAYNYDLATPPAMAEIGLDAFKKFVTAPGKYKKILIDMDRKATQAFRKTP